MAKRKAGGLKLNVGGDAVPQPVAPPRNLDKHTDMNIAGQSFTVDADDLEPILELGRGAYGIVEKMRHRPTGIEMAVKFFGALFREGDVWICMEVMDVSLDKFYPIVYSRGKVIPENILQKITYAVVRALEYLYSKLRVIHRDVKPSNILISKSGEVKICDFGISGNLAADSVAKTIDAGCKPYMAPERIDPVGNIGNYDIRSDVWSLGISLIELATGEFPYSKWGTPFEQLKEVVKGEPPKLPVDQKYSDEIRNFLYLCLKQNYLERPYHKNLLEHPFLASLRVAGESSEDVVAWDDVAAFVIEILC